MSEGAARFKILVVEDEPLIGMEIESAVEALGYEVIGPIAELGKALDLAAEEAIGCAILDVNIRGGNSFPVAELLLARGLPVLLLTGSSKESLPKELSKKVTHLSKPFSAEELTKEIRSLRARGVHSGQ